MTPFRQLLGFALLTLVAATGWTAETKFTLDIKSQPLADAISEFAQQSGLQVVFNQGVSKGLMSSAVTGDFSAEDALTKLLANTQLRYEFLDARTIAIVPESARQITTEDAQIAHLRLARAETADASEREVRSGPKLPNVDNSRNESEKGIAEILVKGSKVLNADIRRTEEDAQPYVVFTQEDLRRSPARTLDEFFKTRLPMNALQGTNSQTVNNPAGNQSSINLRGLGTNQTLILVDGRRMPNINTGGQFGQPDINGIPFAAIERIEVLASTASGIYGGGATGGIVNIIMRKDYSDVEVGATYGSDSRSDVSNYRISGSGGFSLEGGRTNILIAASYSDADPLLIGDRDFARRGRELQVANNPAAFLSPTTPPMGYTTNIRNQNGQNLVLKTGTPLNSPYTFVPRNYAGPATDNGATLVANAGRYNLDLPNDLNSLQQSLINHPAVSSLMLNLRRDFGARVNAFVDLSRMDNRGDTLYSGVSATGTLPATAPNNPFTTPITIRYPVVHLPGAHREARAEVVRAAGGFIVRLPGNWSAATDYTWSRSRSVSALSDSPLGDPDGSGPGISADTAVGNGTLNVMRDTNAFPLDWSPFLLVTPNTFSTADTEMTDATLRISGPVFQVWGGPVNVTGLVESREEKALRVFQESLYRTPPIFFIPGLSQKIASYYLEATAPLVAAGNAMPMMRTLELQVSARHDKYDTRAASPSSMSMSIASRDAVPALTHTTNRVAATKHTVSLRYSPVEALALRASYGTGFLPPSISQIVPSPPLTVPFTNIVDPKRGNVSAPTGQVTFFGGGNPNLTPEESESWSLGAVITPGFLESLRISIDYTRIKKTNEIRQLLQQQIVDLEAFFPERLTRAPLTAADAALGYTGGVITSFTTTAMNIAAARLEAYDLQADYAIPTDRSGTFRFYTIATWQPHLERQALPLVSFVDSAGFNTGNLKWRGNVGLTWERRNWTLNWNGQYYDAYFVYAAGSPAATITAAVLNQGSDTIGSQVYHDVSARYTFDPASKLLRGALANTEIELGIQNVLDKHPPVLATTGTTGGYSTYGDPRLRSFHLTLRRTF